LSPPGQPEKNRKLTRVRWQPTQDGEGKFQWGSGDVYEGAWDKEMRPHGKGKYVWHDGESYDGDWDHGLKHGKGMGWLRSARHFLAPAHHRGKHAHRSRARRLRILENLSRRCAAPRPRWHRHDRVLGAQGSIRIKMAPSTRASGKTTCSGAQTTIMRCLQGRSL